MKAVTATYAAMGKGSNEQVSEKSGHHPDTYEKKAGIIAANAMAAHTEQNACQAITGRSRWSKDTKPLLYHGNSKS